MSSWHRHDSDKPREACGKFLLVREDALADLREIVRDWDPKVEPTEAHLNQLFNLLKVRPYKFDYRNGFDPESLWPLIEEVGFPYNSEVKQALDAAWAASNYARNEGAEQQIFDAFEVHGFLDYAVAQTWLSLIEDLGEQQDWALSAKGRARKAEIDRGTRRKRMVASILGGK